MQTFGPSFQNPRRDDFSGEKVGGIVYIFLDEIRIDCKVTVNNSFKKEMYIDRIYDPGQLIKVIPDSVISITGFSRNSLIEKIDIPFGVRTIENYAFGDCKNLNNVTISDSVTEIGSEAFYNCSKQFFSEEKEKSEAICL